MIFLPNKIERYIAALRLYLHQRILKNGVMEKHGPALRKIYIAEALLLNENAVPINIQNLIYNLLDSVYIIKKEKEIHFSFNLAPLKNSIIKQKVFTAFLLELCRISSEINISQFAGNIIIKCEGEIPEYCILLLKKLGGITFYERKTNRTICAIPVIETEKTPIKQYETTESYVLNPLSIVNIFL